MQRLIIATHNAHKTREFAQLLGEEFKVVDLSAHPEIPPQAEDGQTFAENATAKAINASKNVSGLVIADDSGLEVHALGGAPGIFRPDHTCYVLLGDGTSPDCSGMGVVRRPSADAIPDTSEGFASLALSETIVTAGSGSCPDAPAVMLFGSSISIVVITWFSAAAASSRAAVMARVYVGAAFIVMGRL